ncbi:MAG: nucleoside phosphorylase [Candidatus Izimaplasma sp.]|nr:nucleoside phosphorylase [Candidatus Izimaplasma bacterium]
MGIVSSKGSFDGAKALIEPSERLPKLPNMPKRIVLTFFRSEVERLYEDFKTEIIYKLESEMGEQPVYKFRDSDVGLVPLGIGAPLAAGMFEEIIALGGETFICCGGAGTLINKELGALVFPTKGVRDEGTSYHYVKAKDEIEINRHVNKRVKEILNELKIDYIEGTTWTTDAFYRETPGKIEDVKQRGCLTVEMEFTALAAVAEYRNVKFAELLYCGDDLSANKWEGREWNKQEMLRKDLIFLSKDIVSKL